MTKDGTGNRDTMEKATTVIMRVRVMLADSSHVKNYDVIPALPNYKRICKLTAKVHVQH